MRICFLAGTLASGGAERQAVFMLRAAIKAGFAARLICLTKGEAFEAEIRKLGIEIDYIGASPNRLRRLFEITRNLRKKPAEILHSTHFYTNIYAGLAGKIGGIPSIGAIRSDFQSEIEAHGKLGKWQLKLPAHLIVNNRAAFQRAVEYGVPTAQIDLVRNVVEIALKARATDAANCLKILFVGRLVAVKQPEVFVRLARILEEKLPDHRLDFQIVGDGPLRAELETAVRDLKLDKNQVSFLGWQDDLNKIYGQADIFVLTSRYEGMPNVILEAMARGIPIVATNVGGVSELVDKSRGILVSSGRECELAEAVGKLVSDEDLRFYLGAQGQEFVRRYHSPEYLEERLREIYTRLTVK